MKKSAIINSSPNVYEIILSWIPVADQYGPQSFCAGAIDTIQLQSNQWCITFLVGFDSPDIIRPAMVQGLPVAYCLMSNRRAATYIELFQRLKHEAEVLGMQFKPINIVSDFETALIPAVRQEFSEAIHTGCLFHFMQTVHRKIMGLGLHDDYTRCPEIREQCKQLIALSLMPIHEVERQYKRLRDIASASLDDLFIYFHRQWINGNVSLTMWNFHELDHRTNNISEGKII
ncbi:unnamed protein product [Adineta steineri]|uniref:MULE transposase domain-containing protein n=1 Tax=Adineta steineri TaxID=433720 RepID=A0A813XSR2_9BILA|nr:unnamed protein product [Adineta steineri]